MPDIPYELPKGVDLICVHVDGEDLRRQAKFDVQYGHKFTKLQSADFRAEKYASYENDYKQKIPHILNLSSKKFISLVKENEKVLLNCVPERQRNKVICKLHEIANSSGDNNKLAQKAKATADKLSGISHHAGLDQWKAIRRSGSRGVIYRPFDGWRYLPFDKRMVPLAEKLNTLNNDYFKQTMRVIKTRKPLTKGEVASAESLMHKIGLFFSYALLVALIPPTLTLSIQGILDVHKTNKEDRENIGKNNHRFNANKRELVNLLSADKRELLISVILEDKDWFRTAFDFFSDVPHLPEAFVEKIVSSQTPKNDLTFKEPYKDFSLKLVAQTLVKLENSNSEDKGNRIRFFVNMVPPDSRKELVGLLGDDDRETITAHFDRSLT